MGHHTQTPPLGAAQAVSRNADGLRQALRNIQPAIPANTQPVVPVNSPSAPKKTNFKSFLKLKKKKKVKTNSELKSKPVPAIFNKAKAPKVPSALKFAPKPASQPQQRTEPKRQPKQRSKDRRRSDRRAGNPGSTRGQKARSPKLALNKYMRLSYMSLFCLIFVFGGWTVLAKIQGAVVASGQVAVEGKPKIVQHLEGGIISDIAVKEGDFVTKGQTVVKLDALILQANLEAAETRYFENQALTNRLLSEQKGFDRINWSREMLNQRSNPRVKLAMSGQQQLFEARREAITGEVDQLNQRLEQLRGEDSGLISEIEFTQSELNLVEQERLRMTDLLRQNLVARNRVTQLELDSTRLRNASSKLTARREGLRSGIQETQIQIAQIWRLREEQILTDLRTSQTQSDGFSEVLKTVSTKAKLVQIEAPVSGIVHEMTATTIGGVIAPGQEIMQIIPQRDALIINAQVMPQDIDQVSLGQETNVIFSALKQSAAPELSGVVSYISADNLIDPITGSSYFNVEISIEDSQLSKLQGQTLIPGMPADVFVQTQKRSVFDYLTSPLKDTLKKTMRDG